MRVRTRLLLIFLAVSLAPLLFMRFNAGRGLEEMRREIVEGTGAALTADAEARLRLTVEAASLVIDTSRRLLELALDQQAREVLQALEAAGGQGAAGDGPRHAPQDYAAGRVRTEERPEAYWRFGPGGERRVLPVSLAEQVYGQPEQADAGAAMALRRLGAATPGLRELHARLEGAALWHFTVLESGAWAAYPGHDGLPAGADPRQQPWYSWMREADKPSWSIAMTDPSTGRFVMRLGRTLRDAQGRLLGVTGLAMPVRHLLSLALLTRHAPEGTATRIVHPWPRPDGGMGLIVVAEQGQVGRPGVESQAPAQPEFVEMADARFLAEVAEDVQAQRANLRHAEVGGHAGLWAYGPIGYTSALLLTAPEAGILAPARQAQAAISRVMGGQQRTISLALAGVMAAVLLCSYFLARTVTRPVLALAEGARRLAEGDFDHKVAIRSADEFGDVGAIFDSVGPRLKEHYRLQRSLDLAREVQQSLLPTADPAAPGLDVAGASIYCEQTGGDYYDYLLPPKVPDGRLAVVLGDVAGHGLGAALLMTQARALLRQGARADRDLAQAAAEVNRALCVDTLGTGMFMTMFLLELDPAGRSASWARAGHDPALHYRAARGAFVELLAMGLPLGVSTGTVYAEERTSVEPGDLFVLGSDGIWETRGPSGEMFGKERLRDAVRRAAGLPARAVLAAVLEDLSAFRGGCRQEDDVTLVVAKVL